MLGRAKKVEQGISKARFDLRRCYRIWKTGGADVRDVFGQM